MFPFNSRLHFGTGRAAVAVRANWIFSRFELTD
jgi:hypothetical protein